MRRPETSKCGLAIGTGTDIAIEAADIILVRETRGRITAIKLPGTFRKIRQNYFWAWIYNAIAIPCRDGPPPPHDRGDGHGLQLLERNLQLPAAAQVQRGSCL